MMSTAPALEANPPTGRIDHFPLEGFLEHLRAAGYTSRTLRKKRTVVAGFARWAMRRGIQVGELDESHLAKYTGRWRGKRNDRAEWELATLPQVLKYLRIQTGVASPAAQSDVSPADALLRDYVSYLSDDRGLALNSIKVYSPFIRDFLGDRVASGTSIVPCAFDAPMIRGFLLDRSVGRSSEYARLLATSLRSFSRFLFLRGLTPLDLSLAVPPVRTFRPSRLPSILTPDEVELALAAVDRSTASGRRDHAILLLLARLGLRAGEVVALELDEIGWRAGEILVRGKGRVLERMPLPADVGEALALYLQCDRGDSQSRRVFLRMLAPRVGLTGPGAVGHIVRRALARVAVRPSSRGAAHLFRHSLATKMVRHGASLPQIAEVLRHRSLQTTGLYAHVSFEALRGVAMSWPSVGGAK